MKDLIYSLGIRPASNMYALIDDDRQIISPYVGIHLQQKNDTELVKTMVVIFFNSYQDYLNILNNFKDNKVPITEALEGGKHNIYVDNAGFNFVFDAEMFNSTAE